MSVQSSSIGCLLAVMLLAAPDARAEGFVFIRNTEGTTASLRASEAREMFTGKTKQWKAGAVVQVVLPPEGSQTTKWLAESVFGVAEKVLLTKIRQEVFKGEMKRPIVAGSDAETVNLVGAGPGRIGVVAAEAAKSLPAGVAVVSLQ